MGLCVAVSGQSTGPIEGQQKPFQAAHVALSRFLWGPGPIGFLLF